MVHNVRVGDVIEVHGHQFLVKELVIPLNGIPKLTVVHPLERLER